MSDYHPQHPFLASTYRPDIDGLRAVAIIPVVLFHAFPELLPGGFIGVDVFFVISGYLISTILYRQLAAGALSFNGFYVNRIKRLFPALLLVLLSCLVFGYFILLPDEFSMLGKHTAGGLSFLQNIILYTEVSYFDTAAETKPLLHLWSLGVEEQFYLFFPLFIWGLWKFRVNKLAVITLLTLASFCANLFLISYNSSAAYYLPFSRIWEPLTGCLLGYLACFHQSRIDGWKTALLPFVRKDSRLATANTCLSGIGFVLIGIALVKIDRATLFPGWWGLLPVCGASCIILAGQQALPNRSLLVWSGMVGIGKISYPLYLWHWPLLSYTRIAYEKEPPIHVMGILLFLSLILALGTFLFVESSFRFRPTKGKNMALCVAAICLTSFSCFVFQERFQPNIMSYFERTNIADEIRSAMNDWGYPGSLEQYTLDGIQVVGLRGEKSTLFFGDSLVQQYAPRVEKLLKNPSATRGAVFLTGAGYVPFPGAHRPDMPQLDKLSDEFITLAQNASIDTIVIAGIWFRFFSDSGPAVLVDGIPASSSAGRKKAKAALQKMIAHIPAEKIVYIVSQTPMSNKLHPKNMLQRTLLPPGFHHVEQKIDKQRFIDEHLDTYTFLKELASPINAVFLDPLDFLCPDGHCPSTDGMRLPIYKDSRHIRATYVRENVFYLDDAILGNSGKNAPQ